MHLARYCILCGVIFSSAFLFRIADNDLFARVAVGKLIVEQGSIPLTDPFSFLPTKPIWVDHEWLSGVIFYLTSQLPDGDLSLFLLTVLLGSLTVFFLLSAQDTSEASPNVSFAILFLALFPSLFIWNSVIRSQVFTFLFFAFVLFAITSWEKDRRIWPVVLLPLVFLFWVNAHAGFVVGLATVVLYCIFELRKPRYEHRDILTSATLLCVGATACTPYGVDFYVYLKDALLMPRPLITEWARPTPSIENLLFGLFVLLTGVLFTTKTRKLIKPFEKVLLILTAIAGCMHVRHMPFFFFTASVFLPFPVMLSINDAKPFLRERLDALFVSVRVCSYIAGVLSIGVLFWFVTNIRSFQLDYSQYPLQSMEWIFKNSPGGKLLAHFNEASYVLLKGFPQFKIAIDGRYEETYSNETVEKVINVFDPARGDFIQTLAEIDPELILQCFATAPIPLAPHLPREWRVAYSDESGRCTVLSKIPTTDLKIKDQNEIISSMWTLPRWLPSGSSAHGVRESLGGKS